MGNGFLSTFFLSPKWENQHLSPLVLGGCHRDSPRPSPHLPPGTSPTPPRKAGTHSQHLHPLPPLAAPPAAPSRAPDSPAQPKEVQERTTPVLRPWLCSAECQHYTEEHAQDLGGQCMDHMHPSSPCKEPAPAHTPPTSLSPP
jgi:hypothetical protein